MVVTASGAAVWSSEQCMGTSVSTASRAGGGRSDSREASALPGGEEASTRARSARSVSGFNERPQAPDRTLSLSDAPMPGMRDPGEKAVLPRAHPRNGCRRVVYSRIPKSRQVSTSNPLVGTPDACISQHKVVRFHGQTTGVARVIVNTTCLSSQSAKEGIAAAGASASRSMRVAAVRASRMVELRPLPGASPSAVRSGPACGSAGSPAATRSMIACQAVRAAVPVRATRVSPPAASGLAVGGAAPPLSSGGGLAAPAGPAPPGASEGSGVGRICSRRP